MVENRKLFYAISLMLLTCCQIITMLPHNVASSESSSSIAASTTITTSTSNSNNSENNNAEMQQHDNNNNSNRNNNDDSDSLIIAAERKQKQKTIVSSEDVWETQENDSRPTDNIDDLIFLDKRPINQHHQHEKQLQHHHPHHRHESQDHLQQPTNEQNHFEFHHITMESGSSSSNSNTNGHSDEDTDSLTDTTYSSMIVVDDDDEDIADDGIPHEIELQPDINEEVTPLTVTPLDLSDFLSLIPATKVKTIVNHYYHNDPEVQRAHAFMSSRDFLMLKHHIIAVPEMSAFLRYLNNSGLDLVKFVTALTNLTSYDAADNVKTQNSTADLSVEMAASVEEQTTTIMAETNDIEYAQKQNNKITPTISNIEIQITTNPLKTTTATTTMEDIETTTVKEQLNGLHGLVDSVLDVLPQDQILATFFDKLEANEQFSKLVDNIGSPEFAKILNNMQNSMPLRNLIFTLHNNGIYVIRIVDSLKSYFFLGGF
ncbi:probable serine/threonine-protein kinase drkD [Lucilia sericata]|uniref:probable serine/threonine-protein kinase drkD n=1 Tax=Lucilia sericata TaxID=13632 RepID=UPI0018A841DC|nr:probable serine/threonine-protein kinase drkD [Lucilia sericata]